MQSAPPLEARIESLSHDGRGVARLDGKTVFVDGALPGERVLLRYRRRRRSFDEAQVVEVLQPSPHRCVPKCPHFGVCGGCSLQHLDPQAQIESKQQVLLDNLERLGGVAPDAVLPPLTGPVWGYRRKARLGVKYVRKKGRVLVGFRERHSSFVAELQRCEVLHPSVGERIADLAALIAGLEARERIAQIEVAVSDAATALVLRNLDPLSEADRERVRAFGHAHGLQMWLQPSGPDSAHSLDSDDPALTYELPDQQVTLAFRPTDFTQINAAINGATVARALQLLEPSGERVLDLYCGLGNFTLPLARHAARVVGVEGDQSLIERARANADRNGIANAEFHA
ncbi:MAG TPA: 23S rRNA (uracil(1939)-C(5))-methyltransferase RlmD, partial [Alphaproteobacteria bacterium]|nr:23S rRNA (uracil(1939)-C(5))-methyltransferase RlmD [Alphaproteobacteria bacterium]